MAEYSAGEAKVSIVPDASGFLRKLEADLKRQKAQFDVDVGADITRAGDEIDRFRAEQERRPVKIRAEIDRSGLDQFKKGLSDAASSLGSALKVNLGAAAIGELPALATALTTVAGSMQQLAGAGAILPGVFAGVAADVGVAKLAVMGVGDAFKALDKASDGTAKNVQAANQALAKLAPQTADFVRQTYALKSSFDALQKGVSGKFFDGLGVSVRTLANTDLPVLQRGLGGIATSLNQNLKQLGTSLSSGSSQGLLDRILGNTGNAQARLSKSIDPIIHAFGTLAAVGTDSLPRLADGVGKLADRFDHFVTAAADSGRLDKWINDGITGFDHLGNTLLNIGKIVTDLTGAAGGGGGLLNWLDQGSQKLQAFLSSTQGQDTLRKFFADGKDELNQLLPILKNLGDIAPGVFSAARDAAGVWLPVIKEATDVLAKDPDLVRAIADAFLAWKFVGVITGVSDAVKGITTALGFIGPAAATAGAEGAAGLAPLAATLGPIAAAIAAITGGSALASNALRDWSNANPDVQRRDEHGRIIRGRESQGGATDPNTWEPPAGGGAPGAQRDRRGAPPIPGSVSGVMLPPSGNGGSFDPNPLPIIPGHATGGVLPGYSPGRDNMLVPLAGGEGIIKPEVVRKLGPDYIHALNNGFAGGGVIPLGNVTADGSGGMIGQGIRERNISISGREPSPHGWIAMPPPWKRYPGGPPMMPAPLGPRRSPNGWPIPPIWTLPEPFIPGPHFKPEGPNRPRIVVKYAKGGGVQGFSGGGTVPTIDQWGNPVAPGPPPGPIAPNPTQGGGISGIAGSFLSGLGGPLGQLSGFISGQMGGQGGGQGAGSGKGLTPGFAGLAQAGSDPNLLNQWGQQTGDWLGNFGAKTLTSFGSALWQGALGLVGLQNSILSPSNSWNQAAQKTAGFFLGQNGPLGNQGSSTSSGATSSSVDPNTTVHGASTASAPKGQASVKGANASNVAIAQQAFDAAGFPPTQWNDFVKLENSEAGFNNTAKNPSSTAYGVGQFLDSTWAGYGAKTSDPTLQFQYMMAYIKQRYGTPAAAWKFHQANNWYAAGGKVPGSGSGDTVPAMLTPGEHVLTTKDVAALGGQSGVYALREAIHMADGGAPEAYIKPLPPLPRPPDAKTLQPRRPVTPSTPRIASPAPQAPPSLPVPPSSAAPANPQPAFTSPTPTGGTPDATQSHTLPAISKGITSGFATAGALAQTAASIGSFGAAGAAGGLGALGGGGGGAGGLSISGMFQQFGKIANDVADVASASLVGTLTPGTQESQYGSLLRPAQMVPQTAPLDQGRTYIFNDTHSDRIVDEMRMKDSQDRQAALAQWGG